MVKHLVGKDSHRVKHTGETPYKCDIEVYSKTCLKWPDKKSFSRPSLMQVKSTSVYCSTFDLH